MTQHSSLFIFLTSKTVQHETRPLSQSAEEQPEINKRPDKKSETERWRGRVRERERERERET